MGGPPGLPSPARPCAHLSQTRQPTSRSRAPRFAQHTWSLTDLIAAGPGTRIWSRDVLNGSVVSSSGEGSIGCKSRSAWGTPGRGVRARAGLNRATLATRPGCTRTDTGRQGGWVLALALPEGACSLSFSVRGLRPCGDCRPECGRQYQTLRTGTAVQGGCWITGLAARQNMLTGCSVRCSHGYVLKKI